MKAQIIEKNGHPEFAVIPYADYQHFLELLEDEVDAQTVAEFHGSHTAGREFLVPEEIMRRELAGESPVKLWREQRGLTQQEPSVWEPANVPYRRSRPGSATVRLRRFLR